LGRGGSERVPAQPTATCDMQCATLGTKREAAVPLAPAGRPPARRRDAPRGDRRRPLPPSTPEQHPFLFSHRRPCSWGSPGTPWPPCAAAAPRRARPPLSRAPPAAAGRGRRPRPVARARRGGEGALGREGVRGMVGRRRRREEPSLLLPSRPPSLAPAGSSRPCATRQRAWHGR
jgi:hypothetical protein